jgi:hypothetical protein
MTCNQTLCFAEVHRFLAGLFDGDLHAKRVLSLANATLGVIKTASLAVNMYRPRLLRHQVEPYAARAAG